MSASPRVNSSGAPSAVLLGAVLLLALPPLVLIASCWGETGFTSPAKTLQLLFSNIPDVETQIVRLRFYRALVAAGAGGALALGGALAQGLFRNPLAEPGLLGVSGGAALGAVFGIVLLGGYGSSGLAEIPGALGLLVIPTLSLIGAFAAALFVYRWSARQGNISIETFLLTGLALNSLAGAVMALIQMLLLDDYQITRALLSWGFGTLHDRGLTHVWIVWTGAVFALASVPFLGLELDLLAGGEEDAAALGADVAWVKLIALGALALATAAAVSVCGQIAFVGLLVPHVARRLVGVRHRSMLIASFLIGALLLLGVIIFQNGACPFIAKMFADNGNARLAQYVRRIGSLQPGVMTSLIGVPFFMVLLLRQSNRKRA